MSDTTENGHTAHIAAATGIAASGTLIETIEALQENVSVLEEHARSIATSLYSICVLLGQHLDSLSAQGAAAVHALEMRNACGPGTDDIVTELTEVATHLGNLVNLQLQERVAKKRRRGSKKRTRR